MFLAHGLKIVFTQNTHNDNSLRWIKLMDIYTFSCYTKRHAERTDMNARNTVRPHKTSGWINVPDGRSWSLVESESGLNLTSVLFSKCGKIINVTLNVNSISSVVGFSWFITTSTVSYSTIVNMAAPTAPRGSHASMPPGFEGFPFAIGKPPEDGKQPEQSGEVKKKPCRACMDFKSWMKLQQKQSTTAAKVTIIGSFWSMIDRLLQLYSFYVHVV